MSVARLMIALLWLICLPAGVALGQTLSPQRVLGQYQQFVWQDQHGLPQNAVFAITRTRDGYLWLGTVEGAVRFDGVRFTVFDSNNTEEIKSSQILALLEDREGHLWLGTNGGGLNRYRDGRFTRYTTEEGLSSDHVTSLLEDRAGNLWVGTEGGGLNLLRDGRFIAWTAKEGLPDNRVWALAEDGEGGLWVGTRGGGLARFKDGRFTTYTTRDGLPHNVIYALCWDRGGNLWVGTGGGLVRFRDGRFTVYGRQDGLAHHSVWAIYEDRAGYLWVGTRGGLSRFKDGRFSAYTTRDGLPGDQVREIYQDPEGDLWVGTEGGGLSQLRDGRFHVYTAQDGLPHDFARAIYEDTAGSLWVGTLAGLSRFKDGTFTVYTVKDGLFDNTVTTISEDRAGHLWLGTRSGVGRFHDGRFTIYTTEEGSSSILGDHAGNVWIGTYGSGLNLFRDGRFTVYRKRDGLAGDHVLSLYEDRAGTLWIGTLDGGISQYKDGRFTNWTTKDGLASNHVISFYEDRTGGLWVGTHGGGLSRFKDGKFSTITVKDGLYDNLAFQVLEDDGGDLWMSGNKGIYRASLKELNDFADGRISSVTSFAYGVADGMLSRECNGASPAGWKTRDGRLWFPTVKGVVVIDPQRRNTEPPLVAIEGVTLDRQALPSGQLVRIRPEQRSLEIQYTGLSWNRPQQIKFRYQLAGLDQEWVEAGVRRTAYYSHLPPGEYTFKVIAENGDGVWNTEGQSLRVVVLPPFYRTWWFLSLAALGVAGALLLGYEYRIRQLRRVQATQQAFARQLIESQERERKRIAVELHDSLGQHLVIIRNWALLGAGQLTPRAPAKEELDEIVTTAARAINEVREIAYNLGPYHLDRFGLAYTITGMVNRVAQASRIRFTTDLDQLDGALSREAEMNLFRIVQEALNNLVKHAAATEARVSLRREGRLVRLTITDNGRGFDAQGASPGRGGFGLTSIAERVRLLDGSWAVRSAAGRGTTIEVTVGRSDNQ